MVHDPRARSAFVNLKRLDINQLNPPSNLGNILVSAKTGKKNRTGTKTGTCKDTTSPTAISSVHDLIATLSESGNDKSINLVIETVASNPPPNIVDPSSAEADPGHDTTGTVVIPSDIVQVELIELENVPLQSIIGYSIVDAESGHVTSGNVADLDENAPIELTLPEIVDPTNDDETASDGRKPDEGSSESNKGTATETEPDPDDDQTEVSVENPVGESQSEDQDEGDESDGTNLDFDVTGSEAGRESGSTDSEITEYSGMSK